MDYLKKRHAYKEQADFKSGNTSKIWDSLRKDFQLEKSDFRGYGLSIHTDKKKNIYILVSKFINIPFKITSLITEKIKKILLQAASWFILDYDVNSAKKFGFDDYPSYIYNTRELQNYRETYSKYNIGFSHNSFKNFSYLTRLKDHIEMPRLQRIFEIGAGVFNFGQLISYDLKKFEYIICDLPEMIIKAHEQITELYLPNCKSNYEVFLPNEFEEFISSASSCKVLFITPEQLEENILKDIPPFDLFVNHESFAEMDIVTVNNYLKHVAKLMKRGAIINLVNRHSRPQAKTYEDFKSLSLKEINCFENYELDFCDTLVKEVDSFRAAIPGAQVLPNVFFIGRVR